MKVFRTIVWATLFWILVGAGLRTFTYFQDENSKVVYYRAQFLPTSVQQHLFTTYAEQNPLNAECPKCDETLAELETTNNSEQISTIPETCKSFYDGCNTCNRMENGHAACTMMACETYGEPKCLDEETPEVAETIMPQLLTSRETPTPEQNAEILELQNKVATLELNFSSLVEQLQTIFSTPEGMKLLPAATPVLQN